MTSVRCFLFGCNFGPWWTADPEGYASEPPEGMRVRGCRRAKCRRCGDVHVSDLYEPIDEDSEGDEQ